jgi:Na+-transporting NADH:ubiquinone oxidoreductase subunit NqrF
VCVCVCVCRYTSAKSHAQPWQPHVTASSCYTRTGCVQRHCNITRNINARLNIKNIKIHRYNIKRNIKTRRCNITRNNKCKLARSAFIFEMHSLRCTVDHSFARPSTP